MKLFYFLCTFLLSSFLLFAQSNFLPGSITKSTGEVVNGFIDYRAWARNPSKISFKKNAEETSTSYSVDDLLGFEVTGKEKYIRALIKKDMMPVQNQDLAIMPDNIFETETAFIRELFRNDRIGLYLYRDFKDHFYVSETKELYVELIYGITPIGEENNAFKNQLLTYFPEVRTDAKVNKMLERLKYKESDLTRFFNSVTNTKAKPTGKNKPVFFAGTGIAISTLTVSADYIIALMDYKTNITPVLYAGVDIITRNLGAFVMRPQLSFYTLNYEGTYIQDQEEKKYFLKSNNFSISLGGLYNFWNRPRQKIYGGAEVVLNFSNYTKNELTTKDLTTGSISSDYQLLSHLLKYEKSWFSVNAMVGAIFMKRFEIAACAKLNGTFSQVNDMDITPSIYFVKLGYRF